MVLLIFHLVFSGITYNGIDIDFAEQILEWNAKRYPSGVFFLFGQGRLALFRANPTLAIKHYTAGMEVVQEQFKSLQGISLWELAFAHLAIWDVPKGVEYWRRLKAEAGWSKAMYTYGLAVSLYESGDVEKKEEATRLMDEVPGLLQKIAGKSIPLEVSLRLLLRCCLLTSMLCRNLFLEKRASLNPRTTDSCYLRSNWPMCSLRSHGRRGAC